jgi:hypothetical protein
VQQKRCSPSASNHNGILCLGVACLCKPTHREQCEKLHIYNAVFKNGLGVLQKQKKSTDNTIYEGKTLHCAGQEKEIAVV